MTVAIPLIICSPIFLIGMSFSYTYEAGAIFAAVGIELSRAVLRMARS
jgi:hypothetical protein